MSLPARVRTGAAIDQAILHEVVSGLGKQPKQLPCKLFYDETGADLFNRICTLPEYYPTRTELQIMQTYGAEMAAWIGARARIVEYGSGSGEKTRVLLRHLSDPAEYVPIDISPEQLHTFARSLARELPLLAVNPIVADYTREVRLPLMAQECRRTIVYFPGSTIGNFRPVDAVMFLMRAAVQVGRGGGLLIGVDLEKDPAVLERAYNDAAGVTAAFNRNILQHINRVCDADFTLHRFQHHAFYNRMHGRIEMHLRSRARQRVMLARSSDAIAIDLARNEPIVTEYSYKYQIDAFQSLARAAGFRPRAVWTDAARMFSVHAFEIA